MYYMLEIKKIKFPTPIFHVESIFDGTRKDGYNFFLTKNLKNGLYNHGHSC